mgnify:CR=1 FL=1
MAVFQGTGKQKVWLVPDCRTQARPPALDPGPGFPNLALMRPTFLLLLLTLTAAAPCQDKPALELLLMLPEPRVLRTERSLVPEGAQSTVLSPAREIAEVPGIEVYPKEDFIRLGLSPETFAARAGKAADRLLTVLKPDLVKDAEGRVIYAVYRGGRPVMACLLLAPSLNALFETLLGERLWAAVPDRHSFYLFPAKPGVLEEFTADLAARYREDPHAASPEVFELVKGAPPRVIGAFAR